MRHNIVIDGFSFRLRPIADRDAPFVVKLRSDPMLSSFLHPSPTSINSQLTWQADYYKRPYDWYFVLERKSDSKPEGLISIYNYDSLKRCAEWGRWILRHKSLAAVESAWLIYRCAFEELGLSEVYCRTVVDNQSVVSFHDSCGISNRVLVPNCFILNGQSQTAVEHTVDEVLWVKIRPRLEQLAMRVSERLSRNV